jgi:hypothetical protein
MHKKHEALQSPSRERRFRHRLEREWVPDGDCRVWTGAVARGYGYVQFKYKGHRYNLRIHRLAAHFHLGFDLESDLQVNHRCDNPLCINPEHLYIGTQDDNMRDRDIRGRGVNRFGPF